MNQSVFTITIPRFLEHNPKARKSFPYFMLSKSFFNDDKVSRCTPGMIALYVYLMNVCADYASGTIKVCVNSVPSNLKVGVRFAEVLVRLEELQLLTIEKNESFINRIEKKGIEEKGKEGRKNKIASPAEKPPQKSNLAIARYCELWKDRYKADPPIGGKVAGQIARLVKDHGLEKTISFIEAYLQMPDQWFIKKRHDVTTLIGNLNAVSQFIATGRIISNREINQMDTSISHQNILNMIDRGEI